MLSRSESSSGVRGLDDTTSRLFIDTPDMKGKEGGRDAGTGLLGTSLALPVTHRRGGGPRTGGGRGATYRVAALRAGRGGVLPGPAHRARRARPPTRTPATRREGSRPRYRTPVLAALNPKRYRTPVLAALNPKRYRTPVLAALNPKRYALNPLPGIPGLRAYPSGYARRVNGMSGIP